MPPAERSFAPKCALATLAALWSFVPSLEAVPASGAPATENRPAEITPAEAPFSEARRQLENARALEKGKAPRTQGSARVEAPELLIIQPSSPSAPISPKQDVDPKRNGQWLLDGVKKEALRSREKNEAGSRKESLGFRERRDSEAAETGEEEGRWKEASDSEERKTVEAAFPEERSPGAVSAANPLAGFLKNWMTAKDYALLAPRDERRSSASLFSAPGASEPLGMPSSRILDAGTLRGRRGGNMAAVNNPFMQALQSGIEAQPEAGLFSISQAQPVFRSVPPPPPPALVPALENEKPGRNEQLEAIIKDDDKKYFPQLNRF